MKSPSIWFVYFSAIIALAGVAIHVGAVFGGASWYAFFGAPPSIVASARAGTWLAPVSALVIAVLMGICAVYAGSVLGFVRRPPLQRAALATIAAVCLLRALVLPPLAFSHPELRNTFEVVAALVWFIAGIGFGTGFRLSNGSAGPNYSLKRTAAGRLR
ncbi:MAG: hypothetical protein JSR27_11965 [Proteobacteria bacterium]|nr:hypothetical protein [Nitrospira sp.]MBS0558120.1 hypothetical protein [Pseudomonadota bacterium]